jgi:type IV secretory pathway VirJ component
VLLIGYSFGAGILPFAYNRLPPDRKAAIARISMLSPEPTADFEIRVGEWLGAGPAEDSLDLAPELSGLAGVPVQCIYGEEDEDTACTGPAFAGTEVVRTGGGHHFDGDYPALARRIAAGLEAKPPAPDSPAPGSAEGSPGSH